MPHFAKLDENNIVLEVQVFSQEDVDANGGDYSAGAETFVKNWSGHNSWKQCSYNSNQRGNFPGIGWSWDSANEKFKPPHEDNLERKKSKVVGLIRDPLISGKGTKEIIKNVAPIINIKDAIKELKKND